MQHRGLKIWVDLANSPHVLFFAPLLVELQRSGVEVVTTARSFAQTISLARRYGIEAKGIGKHGGKTAIGKGWSILWRSIALRRSIRGLRPDLAVSHNSYAHALAAWSLGVRSVSFMDYEHTPANHVCFRLASKVVVPSAIPVEAIRKFGATADKVLQYQGFKEQVYLNSFRPCISKLTHAIPASIFERFVVAVARPPADFAIYHRFRNPRFEHWLRHAGTQPETRVVVLPRTSGQRHEIAAMGLPSVIMPECAVDGPNLLYHADLVVSAGGTMNREAAVLGVPTYSMFAGRIGAVDRELARLGRMELIGGEEDLGRIRLAKKRTPEILRNPQLRERILGLILEFAPTQRSSRGAISPA